MRVTISPIERPKAPAFPRIAPPTVPGGHLASVFLKNGERIDHVFIVQGREIAGIYDRTELDFQMTDIQDVQITPAEAFPAFIEAKWSRFNVEN